MGGDNSKTMESNQREAQEREAAMQLKLRALEEHNAKLLEAQRVEQFQREQRIREDEKLRQARLGWQREEVARLQVEKQRLLQEQQVEKQRLLQEQQSQAQLVLQKWQQPVIHSPLQQVSPAPLQQVLLPISQQVPPAPLQQVLLPISQQVPPAILQQSSPLSVYHEPQQRQNIEQLLLQHMPPEQAQALKSHKPRPSLPSVSYISKTSKSVVNLHDSTSTLGTKVSQQTKKKVRSRSTQKVLLSSTSIEWKDADYIQEAHKTSKCVAENIILLLKEKNTIPFIARYRKDMTLGMNADELRNVKTTYERIILIKEKANALIENSCKQGQWPAEFCTLICRTKFLDQLVWLHSIFQQSPMQLNANCRNSLNTPAESIIQGRAVDSLTVYIKQGTEGLNSKQAVTQSLICILADMIFKNENTFKKLKNLKKKHRATILVTKANKTATENEASEMKNQSKKSKYDVYDNFSSLDTDLNPYQIWDIIRGEELKILTISINLPAECETDFKEYCSREFNNASCTSSVHNTFLTAAYGYAWEKLIKSSICKQIMYELKNRAEVALVTDFVNDAKKLLLTPGLKGTVVIGIHPGVPDGCKLAVVSETGELLETETIQPNDEDNPKRKIEAERIIAGMILLHKCSSLALGNCPGYENTEKFFNQLLKKPAFKDLKITFKIVDEKAASFYSKSKEASTEFPNLDINTLFAISIARRLQDPLAELVKIDSTQLWSVIRQRDIPVAQSVGKLNEVITEAVSCVGVDLNTAPISLLRRVSGLNETKAKNIIEWRKSSGPFKTRKDLKKVTGICEKTFEQCAGFIRIIPETVIRIDGCISKNSLDYLDQTSIHPESYDTARAFLTAAKCDLGQFGTKAFISGVKLFANREYTALAKKFNTTVETTKIIIDGLSVGKGCDSREKFNVSKSCENSKTFDCLKIGDTLTGVVQSKDAFVFFVDVGLEKEALLPNNTLEGVTLHIGQRIKVKVNNVWKKRGRIGVTYTKAQ